MADMHSRIVFDHVPKTGGTSVRTALAAPLGDDGHVAEEASCPHHVAIKAGNGRRHMAAHFWFFPGEVLASDWLYATILREPVDRLLSLYYFHRGHRAAVLSGALNEPDVGRAVHLDLADYFKSGPDSLRASTNVQAQHFAWRVCDGPERLTDKNLVDAAIASLESYDVVGAFADMQGFVDACCDRLDVPRQPVPHLNLTPERPPRAGVPRAVVSVLESRNTVDAALYRWAQQRSPALRKVRAVRPTARASSSRRADFGTRHVEIVASRCEGVVSSSAAVRHGEAVVVRLCARASIAAADLTIGMAVRDSRSRLVYGTNTNQRGRGVSVIQGQFLQWSFLIDSPLDPGEYHVTLALHRGLSHLDGCFHWLENATSFTVLDAASQEPLSSN